MRGIKHFPRTDRGQSSPLKKCTRKRRARPQHGNRRGRGHPKRQNRGGVDECNLVGEMCVHLMVQQLFQASNSDTGNAAFKRTRKRLQQMVLRLNECRQPTIWPGRRQLEQWQQLLAQIILFPPKLNGPETAIRRPEPRK